MLPFGESTFNDAVTKSRDHSSTIIVSSSSIFLFFRVDDDLRVQITDNALARDLFPQDYHCLGDNENRPIKWLAIESLLNKAFTTASDVVSRVKTYS